MLDGLLIKLARKPYLEKLLREQVASPPVFEEISEELKLKFLRHWPQLLTIMFPKPWTSSSRKCI